MSDRESFEKDNVVATVKTRMYGFGLAALDSLAIPGLELAIKSVNVCSE